MPELRLDPLVQRWVVIAPERANRPMELHPEGTLNDLGFDPFAEGNEAHTPPETFAVRNSGSAPNGPGWRVRVVPNRYPALQFEDSLKPPENFFDQPPENPFYQQRVGWGVHEVIIECPHNEASLSRLSRENFCEIIEAYQQRLLMLKQDPRLVHVTIFKNSGWQAGASVRHTHSQLIATPVVPMTVNQEIEGGERYFRQQGQSLFHELILQEMATGSRIVLETNHFLVFCPYASRFPFETCILPKQQKSHFEMVSPAEKEDLGGVLKNVLQRLERVLSNPAYNYVIHTAPFTAPELPHYRWHLEILPRITGVAGFEWGSGLFINPVPPEEAAQRMRDSISNGPNP